MSSDLSPTHRERRSRRHQEEDDGEAPWWEQDRRSATAAASTVAASRGRGFDDDDNYHRGSRNDYSRGDNGGGGYYDRDRVEYQGGLPYDEPPPSRPSYGDRRRGGGGGGTDGYRRSYNRGGDRRSSHSSRRSVEQHSPPSRSNQLPPPIAARPLITPVATTQAQTEVAPQEPKKQNRVEDGEIPTPELDLTPSNVELDAEAVLAERRRKRAEILAKYASAPAPTSTPAPAPASSSVTPSTAAAPTPELRVKREGEDEVGTPGREEVERKAKRMRIGTDSPALLSTSLNSSETVTRAPSTAPSEQGPDVAEQNQDQDQVFDLEKDASVASAQQADQAAVKATAGEGGEGEVEVNAADYDPDQEDDDRGKRETRVEQREGLGPDGQDGEEEEDEEEEDDEDDEDDMFAIPSEKPKKEKKKKSGGNKKKTGPIVSRNLPSSLANNPSALQDNYDDPEGYYKAILGEGLDNNRYVITANIGKGMFSGVIRARDLGVNGEGVYPEDEEEGGLKGRGVGEARVREVAIKVVRSQESMYKAAHREAALLRRLRQLDLEDKKHVVKFLRTFEHRGHYCMVFEALSMNLREVLKRYGKNVGLNLRAVRAYASQMFLALSLMKKAEVLHADLKPDNILVNESKSTLKVCDLGSASDVTENEFTPYLVSRFYRAPEVILGLSYDCSLDVWSIACTMYELYTGKILFPGRTNNHMLLLIMETKGKFNHKQIKKGKFWEEHFDADLNFLYREKNDTVTTRAIPSKPPQDLRSRLMPPGLTRKMKDDEVRLLASFVDLLDKMLALEGGRRPTPKELLNHPFIRG
ncbi:hypothetical protein JCM11641_006103 [Rhodosporidiobolus odoratus]